MNNCPYAVTLVFSLPIETAGNHSVTVQDYWEFPTGSPAFTCAVWAYPGTGIGTAGNTVTFGSASQSYISSVNVTNGESIQLMCWGVPTGAGIANINWNQ